MSTFKPHVVTPDDPIETDAAKIRRLQDEARGLAKDHLWSLVASIVQTEAIAKEIAKGGPIYHDGAQERARQIGQELESQRTTLVQILERNLRLVESA